MPARVSVASFASVTSYDHAPSALGARDLAQEVGAAVPALVGERRLVDDVRAVAHRGESRLDAVVRRVRISATMSFCARRCFR